MQLCNFTAVLYGSQDWAMSSVIWQLVCSRGKKFFPFPKRSDRPWAHPDSCSVGTRGPFRGLKWLVLQLTAHIHLVSKVHAADCSHPFSAKVNNVCCYTSVLLHVFVICTGTPLCVRVNLGLSHYGMMMWECLYWSHLTGNIEVRFLLYLWCNNCKGHLPWYNVTGESATGARWYAVEEWQWV
jgi:hypothetical protein